MFYGVRRNEFAAENPRKLRVALVLEKFDPRKGGLEHWTWQFARQLVARGHEPHVVAFEASGAERGIMLHRLDKPRSRLGRAAAFEEYLRTQSFDVVHDMGAGWRADILHPHGGSTVALWEHNLMRIPKWRQIRFWREKRYREMAELEKRQHAQPGMLIVAVSNMARRHFEEYHQLPASRMRLIYNGADTARFSPGARAERRKEARERLGLRDETLFLMLAHNLLLKNADTFIRAVGRLSKAGYKVRAVIAGAGRTERFRKLAASLGCAREIQFPGVAEDPVPLYAAADVFAHPTWYDPCSLVTLEAQAIGIPVITSRFNGASELMADGQDGFVLSAPDNVEELTERMRQLLDGDLRGRMGATARQLALGHSFDRQTSEFLALYEQVRKGA